MTEYITKCKWGRGVYRHCTQPKIRGHTTKYMESGKNILRAILMSDVEQKNPKLSKNQFRNKIGSLRLADFDKKIQLGGDGER